MYKKHVDVFFLLRMLYLPVSGIVFLLPRVHFSNETRKEILVLVVFKVSIVIFGVIFRKHSLICDA